MYEHCHKQIFQNFHIQIIFRKFWADNTQYSTAKNSLYLSRSSASLRREPAKMMTKLVVLKHTVLLRIVST
jgi:hypothetical protein